MTAFQLQALASFSTPLILALMLTGLYAVVWHWYLRDDEADTHNHRG